MLQLVFLVKERGKRQIVQQEYMVGLEAGDGKRDYVHKTAYSRGGGCGCEKGLEKTLTLNFELHDQTVRGRGDGYMRTRCQ